MSDRALKIVMAGCIVALVAGSWWNLHQSAQSSLSVLKSIRDRETTRAHN